LSLSKVGKKLTVAEFDALAAKAAAQVAENQNNSPAPAQIRVAMTREIVQDLEGKMSKIREKMKKIITDPTIAPEQQVKDLAFAQKEYCAQLKMIRMLNGGTLPPQLEDEWKSNRCDDFLL